MAHRVGRGIALLFLDHGIRRGQRHAPAALCPRKRSGTHCTGAWLGPRAGLDRCGKPRPLLGFDLRTIQPLASRYTDYTTRPTNCCIVDEYCCCVVDRPWFSFLQDCVMQVISLFLHAESSPFCKTVCTVFLSKQIVHWRNIVSFYFFLFISGHAKCLSLEQCVAALCSTGSLQKYLERWQAALDEVGRSMLMLTFWRRNYFLNFSTPVYKMWIIKEPNMLELWNKLHFEEKKTESIYHV